MGKPTWDRTNITICIVLAAATLAVYWQVTGFDFCLYDDNIYVMNNPMVAQGLTPEAIGWSFTSTLLCNWHPLTWLSFLADTSIADLSSFLFDIDFGRGRAGMYHLTNAVLHTANVVILFLVLSAYTGFRWRSAFVAGLFALHPLHVESVAWIAERKDVLSTLFWFLTMWAYLRWVKRPESRYYRTVVYMFLLGLISKPMLVTLPITLLLLDFWPLGRFEPLAMEGGWRQALIRLAREKAPLFGLSVIFSGIALWAQSSTGAVQSFKDYPFWIRLLNAFDSVAVYLWKMVWPVKLAAFYPHPGENISVVWSVAAGLAILAMSVLAIRLRRRAPYLTIGWLWYVITLLPVLGLVQLGSQAMADRYTYIPLLGVFIAIAYLLPNVLAGLPEAVRRPILGLGSVGILAALFPVCYAQTQVWRTPESLFGHAIAVTKDNATAYNSYGFVAMERGDIEVALKHFRQALKIAPGYLDARYNYATALRSDQDLAGAESEFKRLLRDYPRHPFAQNGLGDIYLDQHRFGDAIRRYRLALRDSGFMNPSQEATVRNSLGIALVQSGRVSEAVEQFGRAVQLDPSLQTARENLDRARSMQP
jgi:Tfp pilus assembly protein PilF